MRLGRMHLDIAFIASLGNLFGNGGLLSLLVETKIFSQATASEILQGKQYARGMRVIEISQETMYRLFFGAGASWLSSKIRN